jgi:hypothetical protein
MDTLKFTALIFFAALGVGSYAQSGKDTAASILAIKNIYRQINGYSGYATVTIENSEDFLGHATDNGGSLTGFYKGDSLKKIAEWIGLSNSTVQREYYFDKGQLVFVYALRSGYRFDDSTGRFDYSKLEKVFEGRYYFKNAELLGTLINDQEPDKTKQENAEDLLSSARAYSKLLNAKRAK